MKKFLAVTVTAVLAVGLALIAVAAPASAHDHSYTPSCSGVSVDLENYTSGGTNTVKVTIDGTVVTNQTFVSSFKQNYPFSATDTVRSYQIDVTAWDGNSQNGYNLHTGPQTVTGCTTTVTPVTPTVTTVTTCGTGGSVTLPTTTGVTYTFVTGHAGMTEGAWAVDATPASSSYVFSGAQIVHFSGDLGTKASCVTITTAPSATDLTCVQNSTSHTATKTGGYIQVKPIAGVTYTITGGTITAPIVIVSSGTAPVDTKLPAGSYTVTASGTNLTGKTVFPLAIVDTSPLCTLPFTSGSIGSGDQTCASGKLVSGYITTFVDPTVTYSLNGATLGAKTNVAPGTYTVQMTPAPGFSIGAPSATVTVHGNTIPCGQLATLAFTGSNLIGFGYLSAAALFLMAGGLFVSRSRRRKNLARG